jgi:hypothetical protein
MVQARFTKQYNTDLVSLFNQGWQRNESVGQLNEVIKLGNAKQADADILALSAFSTTLGGYAEQIHEKNEKAKLAEEKMTVFLDMLFDENDHLAMSNSAEEDEAFIGILNQENFERSKYLQEEKGASFEVASDSRVAQGVRGYEIAKLHVFNEVSNFSQFMDGMNDPDEVFAMPGAAPFKMSDANLTMQQKTYARMSQLRKFFSQEAISSAPVSALVGYMPNLVTAEKAWRRQAQIATDYEKSENERGVDIASYFAGNKSMAETLAEISITRNNKGKMLGHDGAMVYMAKYFENSIDNSPLDGKSGIENYNKALKFLTEKIPEGYKDAGKTYGEAYPTRFGMEFRGLIDDKFKEWRTANNKFQGQAENEAQFTSVTEIKKAYQNGEIDIEEMIIRAKREEEKIKEKFGIHYNDEGPINKFIEKIINPTDTTSIRVAEHFLNTLQSREQLHTEDAQEWIDRLPPDLAKTWNGRRKEEIANQYGGAVQLFEKDIGNDILNSAIAKMPFGTYEIPPKDLNISQTHIVKELGNYFREQIKNELNLLDRDPTDADMLRVKRVAKKNTLAYFKENGGYLQQWDESLFRDTHTHGKKKFFTNFEEKLVDYPNLLEVESKPASSESNGELNQNPIVVSYRALKGPPNANRTMDDVFNDEDSLKVLFKKQEAKNWERTWGPYNQEIPVRVRALAKELNLNPIKLMNIIRDKYKFKPLKDTKKYHVNNPVIDEERNKTEHTPSKDNVISLSSAYLRNGLGFTSVVPNGPNGFGVLLDEGDYPNPNLAAAIFDSITEGYTKFEPEMLWQLDDILSLSDNDAETYLNTLPDEERIKMDSLFWMYGIAEGPQIRKNLINV